MLTSVYVVGFYRLRKSCYLSLPYFLHVVCLNFVILVVSHFGLRTRYCFRKCQFLVIDFLFTSQNLFADLVKMPIMASTTLTHFAVTLSTPADFPFDIAFIAASI